jgi:hypothetical protein
LEKVGGRMEKGYGFRRLKEQKAKGEGRQCRGGKQENLDCNIKFLSKS